MHSADIVGNGLLIFLLGVLQFQLTVNFVALCVAFVAAITNGETPLTVIQLLWVNLIMDALGALGEPFRMAASTALQTCFLNKLTG